MWVHISRPQSLWSQSSQSCKASESMGVSSVSLFHFIWFVFSWYTPHTSTAAHLVEKIIHSRSSSSSSSSSMNLIETTHRWWDYVRSFLHIAASCISSVNIHIFLNRRTDKLENRIENFCSLIDRQWFNSPFEIWHRQGFLMLLRLVADQLLFYPPLFITTKYANF